MTFPRDGVDNGDRGTDDALKSWRTVRCRRKAEEVAISLNRKGKGGRRDLVE